MAEIILVTLALGVLSSQQCAWHRAGAQEVFVGAPLKFSREEIVLEARALVPLLPQCLQPVLELLFSISSLPRCAPSPQLNCRPEVDAQCVCWSWGVSQLVERLHKHSLNHGPQLCTDQAWWYIPVILVLGR